MSKRTRTSFPLVGGSSLLVIFAVLCLTVFALLGLSTVQADRRLSDASAEAVSAYYRADLQAEAILAQLRQGEHPDGVEADGDFYFYTCPISDTQQLQVEVYVSGEDFDVFTWKTVSTVEWEGEELLDIWDGEFLF